jgi:hypothetical protein
MSFLAVLGSDPFAFFTGTTATSRDVPPNTVALGNRIYPIDLRLYRHSSQETLRDSAAIASEQSDALFNANGAWARYRHSLHLGAGQEVADFREDVSEYRFRTSYGIDVWEDGVIKLLKAVSSSKTLTTAGNQLCVSNTRLYVSDGADLYYTSDLVSWSTATAPGGTILSLTTDGTDLYCATSTVMKKYATGAPGTPVTFSTAVTGNCTLVRFVGNRLLMAKDNVLYEVGSTGALTTITTHFQSAFKWTAVFAVGSRIYIGGYAGQRSEIYTLTVDSSGNLVRNVEAAPLPIGELLNTVETNAGIVMLCSSKGVRFAQVGADGTLTYGPLLDDMGDVRCGTFEGRFAWSGWTNHPASASGTARFALDQMVSVLQPAYASDLYETTASSGHVTGVARFNNKTVFVVDGANVFAEASTYVTQGVIQSGEVYFGTVEDKALTQLDVVHETMPTGTTIVTEIYGDTGVLLESSTKQAGDGGDNCVCTTLDGAIVRHAEVYLTLKSTGTNTPEVHYWRLRAYPIPPAVYQWIVPLILHTRVIVNQGMGQELSMNVLDEASQIRDWFESREQITYQEGDRAYRVRVDAFELQPAEWTDEGKFFQHTMVVRLVSA